MLSLSTSAIELLVQRVAAALVQPGHVRQLVHAGAAAGRGVGEQAGGRVLARPVVRPGIAAVDHALVHRVDDLEGRHHRAVGQHLHLQPAVGHLVDAVGHALHQVEIDARAGHRGLDLQPRHGLRQRRCRHQRAGRRPAPAPSAWRRLRVVLLAHALSPCCAC